MVLTRKNTIAARPSASTKFMTKVVKPGRAVTKAGKGKAKLVERAPRSRPVINDDDSDESEGESGGEEEMDERATMLAALEAHGRSMFGLGDAGPSNHAEKSGKGARQQVDDDEDEEEEEDEEYHTDDGWVGGEFDEDEDDDEVDELPLSSAARVPEVVFAPTTSSSSALMSKAERKAFLTGHSAKMMGIPSERETVQGRKRPRTVQEEEDDQSNLKLDKSLHQMLLTTLLPAAQADSASRPVDKRNAISGRLRELASFSLPGEGSGDVSSSSLSSHPAHVRTGLLHAQQRRDAKARAEAKAAGSWVKGAGGLGDLGKRGAGASAPEKGRGERKFAEVKKKKGMDGRKEERMRGLGMGVGRFEGGALKLTEREIARVNGIGKGGKGKGKKKGGKIGGKW